ncbi:alpha/beta hydrolase [Verminephrobacter aporrectodeae subsp. tuberculatae]|uniref:Alpha/beta hydrolase n=1 Tax=Verminephrobacter aporrectodeae subsp. tuberculatae TaxID=1110392 RepID=A0ABT3KR17_9BURK|nr:alpha/beta hydrolase [Verminephrobacter aporrectodeae subsp. tuberculatae]
MTSPGRSRSSSSSSWTPRERNSLGQWWGGEYTLDEYHQRLHHVRDCRSAVVRDVGHMLHHDQPGQVAQLIEQFLDAA